MSVKSFDESEASEKRVKSKKITHTTLFFQEGGGYDTEEDRHAHAF